jgi:hypothetical protein
MRRRSRRDESLPPEHPQYPEEIAGFIHDVHNLRTTMASDLSAAAGAVESDEPGVASDFIEGGRGDLAALGLRAGDPGTPVAEVPTQRRHHRGSSAVRAVAAATVPLLATAAVGAAVVAAYTIHHDGPRSETVHTLTQSPGATQAAPIDHAAAMLAALNTDVRRGASPATIAARAALLHDELARLISTAAGDRQTLTSIRRMLATEDRLLTRYADPRVRIELRSVRALEASLNPRPTTPVRLATPTAAPPSPVSTAVPHRPTPSVAPTHPAVHKTHAPKPVPSPTASPPATTPPLPLPTLSPGLP